MNYDVIATPSFIAPFRKLLRKYPSLKEEYIDLVDSLEKDPFQGQAIGKGCYKIRIAIKSKGKGKRGGGRVITFVHVIDEVVKLIFMYSKGDKNDISDQELKDFLADLDD